MKEPENWIQAFILDRDPLVIFTVFAVAVLLVLIFYREE